MATSIHGNIWDTIVIVSLVCFDRFGIHFFAIFFCWFIDPPGSVKIRNSYLWKIFEAAASMNQKSVPFGSNQILWDTAPKLQSPYPACRYSHSQDLRPMEVEMLSGTNYEGKSPSPPPSSSPCTLFVNYVDHNFLKNWCEEKRFKVPGLNQLIS